MRDVPIEHSGILGMKWGIRRYQNKDGSLTPAGRERYGSFPPKSGSNLGGKDNPKPKRVTNIKDLSNDELNKRINRIRLEQQYRDLTKPANKEKIISGRKIAKALVDKSVTPTITAIASYTLAKYVNAIFNDEVIPAGKKKKDD